MPIAVTCGGCRKTYQVKDSANGKKIRCPKCGEAIAVQSPDDDEYEDYDDVETTDNDDDDSSSRRRAPKVKAEKPTKKKKRRKSILETISPVWLLVPFLAVATVVTVALLFVLPPLARLLSFGVMGGGVLIAAIGGIQCRSAAYEEDTATGMMFYLVPGYAFYYIFSRWSSLMPYSAMWLIGVVMLFGGIGLERAAKTMEQRQVALQSKQRMDEWNQPAKQSQKPKLPDIAPRPSGPDTRQRQTLKEADLNYFAKSIPANHRISVGDRVWCRESPNPQHDWYLSEVLSTDVQGQIKVHFIGWEDRFDATIPLERVMLLKQ